MTTLATLLLAWLFEAVVGWPDLVYRRIRHPVVWLSALIDGFDRHANRDDAAPEFRRAAGVLTTLAVTGVAVGVAFLLVWLLPNTIVGYAIEVVLASSLIASRSLYTQAAAVARPLTDDDLPAARQAVARLVGRDAAHLDKHQVASAALERLAEGASNAVVAPVLWGLLFGLPGIAGYKAISTLDSMIGHRTAKHAAFGAFATRLDDLINWIPARLTGAVLVLSSLGSGSWKTMWRDAGKHRSPNAGWPQAAMAGALKVRLSGPRHDGEQRTEEPWLNAKASAAQPLHLRKGLQLYVRAMLIVVLLLVLVFALTSVTGSRIAPSLTG